MARVVSHHCLPQRLRTRRCKQPEAPRQHHLVTRTLVLVAPLLVLWRAHPETPRWHRAQTLTNAADPEGCPGSERVLAPILGPRRCHAPFPEIRGLRPRPFADSHFAVDRS